jgi:hypothetical protein
VGALISQGRINPYLESHLGRSGVVVFRCNINKRYHRMKIWELLTSTAGSGNLDFFAVGHLNPYARRGAQCVFVSSFFSTDCFQYTRHYLTAHNSQQITMTQQEITQQSTTNKIKLKSQQKKILLNSLIYLTSVYFIPSLVIVNLTTMPALQLLTVNLLVLLIVILVVAAVIQMIAPSEYQ